MSLVDFGRYLPSEDILINALGSFLGAFFAFIFFIIGEKYKAKIEWRKAYKNEHSYLERYLSDVHGSLLNNKRILGIMASSYKEKALSLISISEIPIRENISMKIDDLLFMNKVELYISKGLKNLNSMQRVITLSQEKINEDILSGISAKRIRAEKSLSSFEEDIKEILKYYDFFLEVIDELIIENRILLIKYKKWSGDIKKLEEINKDRKAQIEELKKKYENIEETPVVVSEYIERLKKFDLYKNN